MIRTPFRHTFLILVVSLLAPAGRTWALTAGTGMVMVHVSFGSTTRINVTATFDSHIYDLPGVNLGTVGTLSATSIALTDVNLGTGASFAVPFANGPNSFRAVGDIACPSGGCLALPGTYAFVGTLDNVAVSILPTTHTYTFDGSVSCTGNVLSGVDCAGVFGLNAFDASTISPGADVTVDGSTTFFDPTIGMSSAFQTHIELMDVSGGSMVVVTGFSRLRGTIPAGYSVNTGGFRALFLDVSTDAVFTSGRLCVRVDADGDGIVDGTSLRVDQLALLHFGSGSFAVVPLVFPTGFVCADGLVSFSPFVLLVNTAAVATTTTTTPSATTTSTTLASACSTIDACEAALDATLPSPATAASKKAKKVALKLGKLDGKARKALGQLAGSNGKKRLKLESSARNALRGLLAKAATAAGKGTLGVPLAPLQAAANALLAVIPST